MEFEVYESAVKYYKEKYDVYGEWNIIDGSDGRPFRKSMQGYYLVNKQYPKYCIVGDVLTSNKVWGNAQERNNPEINRLLELFKKIYHCNGNYVPIPEIEGIRTANLSGKNCDTYTHHLNVYKDAIEGKLKNYVAWKKWAEEIWIP